MKTQTSKRTLFAMTGLATVFAAAPIVAHAGPPTIINGHHNGTTGSGYTVTSGSSIVTSTWTPILLPQPVRVYTTTFNGNKSYGLAVEGRFVDEVAINSIVTVRNGQFDNNSSGIFFYYGTGTIENGQFNNNDKDGLYAIGPSTINNGTFDDNKQYGLHITNNATGTVYGGQFSSNQYGLYTGHSSTVTVAGGTFANNTQADLCADNGTITLAGNFRGNHPQTLTDSGSLDVLFPGSKQWQTLKYKTINGGKIVLKLLLAPSSPINSIALSP